MKNKLLPKKYYFCKSKEDAAMTPYLKSFVLLIRLYNFKLLIVNFQLGKPL